MVEVSRLADCGVTAKDSLVKEIVDLLVGSSYKKAEEPFTENWKDRTRCLVWQEVLCKGRDLGTHPL